MSCPCIQAAVIPTCATSLVIGVIANISTEVIVYIKNTSTGRITRWSDVVSSLTGEVSIDTSQFDFGTQMNYEVTIVLAGDPISETIEFTIGDSTGNCAWFKTADFEGDAAAVLSESGEPSGVSQLRYRQISGDSGWPPNFLITGVDNFAALVTVTLQSPADYEVGEFFLLKDESGSASLNNIVLVGDFEGSAAYTIISDYGAITFYSNGVDKFFIESIV